ncbi:MAG: cytochrome b/b6 domain-containing protein [bacterium]|nr:cytochrome b/b6 domain-containing protein [bacterium]
MRIYIYRRFERFWHWMQALLVMLLMLTGFEVHGSYTFFGYENAVHYHQIFAIAYLILVVFAIFWHLVTGEWRQYLPTLQNIRAQLDYYLFGIFRNAPHPTRKTALSKLNPLQRIVYFGFKVLVIPVMGLSGILYLFYRYPQQYETLPFGFVGIKSIAYWHTAGAFVLVAFLIAHLYLITTGTTIFSNLKAMITGYEEVTDHHPTSDSQKQEEVVI